MEFNVADLVEAAADAVPEREALVAGDVRHSFVALDRRANRAAHHLGKQIQRQPSGKPDYPWAKRVATEALG